MVLLKCIRRLTGAIHLLISPLDANIAASLPRSLIPPQLPLQLLSHTSGDLAFSLPLGRRQRFRFADNLLRNRQLIMAAEWLIRDDKLQTNESIPTKRHDHTSIFKMADCKYPASAH